MSIALSHIQSSDLSRNPVKVFAAAEVGPVLLTRRDGENFVIMTQREAEARQKLHQFVAAFYNVATDDRGGSLVERMVRQFPWMGALSSDGRKVCTAELSQAATAAFATGQSHVLEEEYDSWFETAEAMAAGLKPAQFDPAEAPIRAERP